MLLQQVISDYGAFLVADATLWCFFVADATLLFSCQAQCFQYVMVVFRGRSSTLSTLSLFFLAGAAL